MNTTGRRAIAWLILWLTFPIASSLPAAAPAKPKAAAQPASPAAAQPASPAAAPAVEPGDWPQWGGSPSHNNTPPGKNIPGQWSIGELDRQTGEWLGKGAENIKWVARLGTQSYGNPVIAGGKVFIGTNNGGGRLARFPTTIDLGCLLCFNAADGKFLWQHSSPKLASRDNDWPEQGICCAPLVEGNRLWFVTSRGEVVCLDTEGFRDGRNDGPFQAEPNQNPDEADVIWSFDMMGQLGVSQHNMCSCSVTSAGDLLFVVTSNGVDESHAKIPTPQAPSFLAMDKRTGKVLWSDNSPGANILHGQWSSPAYAVLGGVPQVVFAGGDGWLYSFLAEATADGKPKLLWQFDCNPKESKWDLSGRGTRNTLVATPVIHDGRVYIAVGEDPEHGEGKGHLWCVDPTRRGDVSPELAFRQDDLTHPLPHRRVQAVIKEQGEVAKPNPNSAAVWHYAENDANGNGKLEFEETMHRSCGTVAIKDGLLFIADFAGLFHCLDVKTGKPLWTHDLLASAWGSPLIVDGKVYIGDEDGDVSVFRLAPKKELLGEINMGDSVYSTPVVAGNVLYISTRRNLFAIQAP